jgi:hypothetical protein
MIMIHNRVTKLIALVFMLVAGAAASYAQTADAGAGNIVGTVVRFTAGATSVDLIIGEDNPTVRDFLSLLPVTMNLEEYAGREKIGYFSRKLVTAGSPGSDPEDGDLIYFTPWGNIGFYYNASGIGYSDMTIHIGKYRASPEQLQQLVEQPVRVEIVQ